jgi:stearoyl-CoA desaturase (Delta-9 desaturase)
VIFHPISRYVQEEMPLSQRVGNLFGVTVPFVGALTALVLAWQRLVGVRELVLLVVLYVLSALGTSVGFHRLLTHRSFETYRGVKYVLAILGTLSVQGTVVAWVASHRKHHAHADAEGDPHSPHVEGGGFLAGLMGLWHAHMGWLLARGHRADPARYAKDLIEDRGMRVIARAFPLIVLAGLALPFGIGLGLGGTIEAGLAALVVGGFARVFLWHHVTFSVNSLCHFFGSRQYETEDRSTNLFWLALPSMGEAWHNNHHAFPRSAVHGLRWWQLDPSALVIRAMAAVGLAWNVIEISPERQRQKAHQLESAERKALQPG